MGKTTKIAIIGAGHVGSHCASALAWTGVAEDIVLIDSLADKAFAQASDIADALTLSSRPVTVRSGDYAEAADADIVLISIGEPWKSGQTRLDLFDNSIRMLDGMLARLKPLNVTGLVVTITNPADIVADYVRVGLGLPRFRCFGTGTLLDTARLVRLVSLRAGVSSATVSGLVMGEHGDSSVSVFSQVRIGGKPAREFPSLDAEAITRETRQGGMLILAGKGYTEFGIGQVTSSLCAALTGAKSGTFPLSVLLEGEYGQTGIHAGVPCKVGPAGIEEIVSFDLSEPEKTAFDASCDIIRGYVKRARPGA